MTPADDYSAAKRDTDTAVSVLSLWITEAQKALSGDRMDATARARLGELLINACRYLAEREASAKKAADRAEYEARPEVIAMERRSKAVQLRAAGEINY